jgi:hypothetical protein
MRGTADLGLVVRLIVLGFLLCFFGRLASAATITYSQFVQRGSGASGTFNLGANLPLFDVSRPEIPDNATLQSVQITIQESLSAILDTGVPANGSPTIFQGSSNFGFSFNQPLPLSGTVSFPFVSPTIQPGSSFSQGYGPSITLSGTTANVDSFTPAGNNDPFVFIRGVASFSLYISPSPAFPIFTVNDIVASSGTYTITYNYGVADSGWTVAFLGISMLGLIAQSRAFRRRD